MSKKKNCVALFFGFSLMIFVLLGILRAESAFAASPDSTKTFSISSSSEFTKKATINKLVVNVNQIFPIYFYATNGGKAQCPAVLQDIPLTVTLINPNNQSTSYNIIIPKGPANTYGILPNISCNLSGKWTVKVSGDPGKGYVTVNDTFTVVGNQASLNVTPAEATISMGATQQFEALFNKDSLAPFNYALFSGSSTSGLSLNGTKVNIVGSTHTNKNFTASISKLKITETCEAVTTVKLNGNQNDINIGKIVQNAPSIAIPDIGNEIIALAQATGQTYNGNKTYNDNSVSFNDPIYVNGDLTINCNQLSIKGPIVATGNITVNSTSLSVTNDAPVSLYSKNGNITIGNSSINLKGMVYAPKGTITMNGSYLTIHGRVIGKEVKINFNELTIDSSSNDLSGLFPGGVTPVVQVDWSSSNPGVATINSSGLATSTGPGTAIITAKYTVNNVLYTDTSQLTVVLPTLEITPIYTIISSGYTQQYRVTRTDYDGETTDVTQSVIWSSSISGYPYLTSVTINESGLATGHGVGTVTIIATDQISGVRCTADLVITMPTLSITPLSKNILPGSTQQYEAILTHSVGNEKNVTLSADWSSDNMSIATVYKGLATGGNMAGTCIITVTDQKSGARNSAALTVMAPTELRLSISDTEPLEIGGNVQVTAYLVYPNHATRDVTDLVTWSTSNPNVVTVDQNGKATGIGGGQGSVVATDSGADLSGSVNLSVQPALLLSPISKLIPIGFEQQYNAQLFYADGTDALDITDRVTWTSSQPDVVEIATTGLATGKVEGYSLITANDPVSGSQGSTGLTVKSVTALKITPVIEAIFVGYNQQFNLQFSDGTISDVLTNSATWTSSDPTVATIAKNGGLATGVKAGTSTISATVVINGESLTGSILLTVLPPKGGVIREWEQ